MSAAYIIDHVRTPRARRKGKFLGTHPVDLLTYPLNALKTRNSLPVEQVEDVVIGCVTQTSEQGWCVARKSVLASGWPHTVPATTVNRLCASGQQACSVVSSGIVAGQYSLAIAGGLEHMTRVPMFSDCTGEDSPLLAKFHPDLVPQGLSAELLAAEYKLSRKELDEFALQSQLRAKKSRDEGRFAKSICAVPYKDETGTEKSLDFDDNIRPETTLEGLSSLKPAFREDGVITAGNASAIVDGAAAILLASEVKARELNLKPRARIVATSQIGSPPKIMLTGPVEASRQALAKAKLTASQIDVWEINEAFAPVTLFTMRELGLSAEKVNINGGGIALGHPLGATGTMLIGMAVDELERTNGRYALVTMCIGLGMGMATIIERV